MNNFTPGQKVIMQTNGFAGTITEKYLNPKGEVFFKVKFFIPNDRGYGYFEEFNSYFSPHELKGE